MKGFAAILEVTAVTAVTWFAYKTLKHFVEPAGSNYSPGFAMLVAAAVMLVLRRRDFASYGILSGGWRSGLNLGVLFALLMLVVGGVEIAFFPTLLGSPADWTNLVTFGIHALRIPAYLALFFLLLRLQWRRSLERVPLACTLALLVALLVAAPAYAVYRGAPPSPVAGLATSLVFFTALGEELFFRGYVQSRLNGVFGRPWRILGASLGPGLLLSALLFGLIHVFNPTRPYEGRWEVAWLWGVNAFLGGLLYGYLRELTGSIWAGAVVHALSGEYKGLWQVFGAKG